MTYRVDYRETVELSDTEHDSVISAIETWITNAPEGETRRFPFYQRHREEGETEIHVIVQGLTYDEVASMQDKIKSGVESLPGTWPDPTKDAVINNE